MNKLLALIASIALFPLNQVKSFIQGYKYPVVQIQSFQQSGPTCGYWSTFNAAALESLINDKKPITEQAISLRAQHIAGHCLENLEEINSDKIEEIITTLQSSALILGQHDHAPGIQPLNMNLESAHEKSIDYQLYFEQQMSLFKKKIADKKSQCVVPFVCNVNNYHWVLVAVVKEQGKKPYIIYMDSINLPATAYGSSLKSYITFIRNKLL